MDDIARKKIITDVVEYGGIGLRRQVLRVHKNGAKFPISKTYIDDEVLNPNITYTIILIPEIKIATETSILLSFFSRKGPSIFYSYPDQALKENEKINLMQHMDQTYNNEFFINQSSIIPTSLNYYFEIPSEWAQGKKEMLLIGIMPNEHITQGLKELLQPICVNFANQLKSDDNSFKGLYINQMNRFPENEQSEIEIYHNALKERMKNLYLQIIQTLQP